MDTCCLADQIKVKLVSQLFKFLGQTYKHSSHTFFNPQRSKAGLFYSVQARERDERTG